MLLLYIILSLSFSPPLEESSTYFVAPTGHAPAKRRIVRGQEDMSMVQIIPVWLRLLALVAASFAVSALGR